MTIREAAAAIRDKRASPVELATAAISRIDRLNPTLRTFITVTAEYALQRARQAETELAAGRSRGPLCTASLSPSRPARNARRTHHIGIQDFRESCARFQLDRGREA